jgi:hypothetical protein
LVRTTLKKLLSFWKSLIIIVPTQEELKHIQGTQVQSRTQLYLEPKLPNLPPNFVSSITNHNTPFAPRIYPPIYPSIYPSFYLSFLLSFYLSIFLSFLLSSFAGRGEDGIEQYPIDEKDVRIAS